MDREFTCILCPTSCEILAKYSYEESKEKLKIEGARCSRGLKYVKQELVSPMRNIASSVLIRNGELPLASVKLDRSIPRNKIMDVMSEIKKLEFDAPVYSGDIALKNVLNLNSNVVFTIDVNQFILYND